MGKNREACFVDSLHSALPNNFTQAHTICLSALISLPGSPFGFYLLFISTSNQKEQVVNTSQCVMRDAYK